mgnify:CR=1 FL=1
MQRLLLFFCGLLAVGCGSESKKSTYFGGKILKPTDSRVLLYEDNTLIDSIQLQSDGTFLKQIDSLSSGLYNFIHKPEFQYVLLEKGDSLLVRINTIDFDESLVYSGRGAVKNNFLINLFLQIEADNASIQRYYQQAPSKFKNHIESLVEFQLNQLRELVQSNNISDFSQSILKAAVYYNYYTNMEQYLQLHRDHSDCKHLNALDDAFYSYRSQLDLNDEILSGFRPYLRYILRRINNEVISEHPNSTSVALFQQNRLRFMNQSIKASVIKNKIARYIAYDYLLNHHTISSNDAFLELFYSLSVGDDIKDEIKRLAINIMGLQPNKPLPNLLVSDIHGNQHILSKVQNRIPTVYFFWSYEQNAHQLATFSRIRNLSKKHPAVSFVGININQDKKPWKQALQSTPKFRNNVRNFQVVDFEILSKKLVLSNLNKVIFTNANRQIIDGFSNIIEITNHLEK